MTRTSGASTRTLERVLVGVDDSSGAEAAAAFGVWLASERDVRVTLLHACPIPDGAASAEVLRAADDRLLEDERAWLRRLEALGGQVASTASIDCRVDRGSPARALVAAAGELDADLIAVGSHGVGRLRRSLVGSVSSQVLLHAPCSVLLFREGTAFAPAAAVHTVLVGIDGSPESSEALQQAGALAAALEARLVLVHVADPRLPVDLPPTEALRHELERRGRAVLADARTSIATPRRGVDDELVEGDAVDELVAACRRDAPAILVVGTRGLGGFKALMVGSTSLRVAGHAPCPVLVARSRTTRS